MDPEGKYRDEDQSMGLSFSYYFNNRTLFLDNTYSQSVLLFPMVKAVKRGFDEVAKFLTTQNIEFTEKYVLSGASKRGWSTFLNGAIDNRIVSSAPLIYDALNLKNVPSHRSLLN